MNEKRFIIWNPKDGHVRRDDDGNIISDGVIGRVSIGNAYIKIYPKFSVDKRPADLEVGERIEYVKYALSGEIGYYDIYRVS